MTSFEHCCTFGFEKSFADGAISGAFWSRAKGRLSRHGTPAADWDLARLNFRVPLSGPGYVFVLPSPEVEQPPAFLWLSNLRAPCLESGWSHDSDQWICVSKSGWAGYGLNRITQVRFSESGGAIEGAHYVDWPSFCKASGIAPELMCALPWTGLGSMWQASGLLLAEREKIAIGNSIPIPAETRKKPRKA